MPKVVLHGTTRIYEFSDEGEAEAFQMKKNHEDASKGIHWVMINSGSGKKIKVVNMKDIHQFA